MILFVALSAASGFAPLKSTSKAASMRKNEFPFRFLISPDKSHESPKSVSTGEPHEGLTLSASIQLCSMSGFISGLLFPLVPLAQALADDDVELADLPPPYVPALFAVALLVGVGVLTGSLGNVMDDEASLGLQSGARAKKEIERSRSSYFKKK